MALGCNKGKRWASESMWEREGCIYIYNYLYIHMYMCPILPNMFNPRSPNDFPSCRWFSHEFWYYSNPQKMPKSGIDHQFSRFYHTYRTIIYHNSPYLTKIYHKLSLYPFIYYHKFIICVWDFANFYLFGAGSGHSATKWFIASAFWAGCQGHPGVPALEIDGGKLDERFHTQKLPKCPRQLFLGGIISVLAIRLFIIL